MELITNKYKYNMKSFKVILSAILLMNAFATNAQDVSQFKPSVNLSYSFTGSYEAASMSLNSTLYEHNSGGSIMVDADLFEIIPRLSGGFHLGFGLMGYTNSSMTDADNEEVYNTIGIHYGFDLHYTVDRSKYWDIQLGSNMGVILSKACIPIAEYGLTSTVKYFPIEKLGIFLEAGWGNYFFSKRYIEFLGVGNANLKVGISYRL